MVDDNDNDGTDKSVCWVMICELLMLLPYCDCI